jgi:pre-rRNA-processing protein TSR2
MSVPAASQSEIMEEFRAGVTACLRSWSAFRTAVEAGWGGVDSQAKADDLRDHIYQIFDGSSNPPRSIEQEDLEDNLAIYLEEQFSVVLEDGSERQVADTLFRMYDGCYKGDITLARQMVAAAESVVASSVAYPVQVQSTEHDDDDDDDDMLDATESDGATATEQQPGAMPLASAYASQTLFGAPPKPKRPVVAEVERQLGESAPEQPQEVELDDDGFAPAQTKGKRKSRKPV